MYHVWLPLNVKCVLHTSPLIVLQTARGLVSVVVVVVALHCIYSAEIKLTAPDN